VAVHGAPNTARVDTRRMDAMRVIDPVCGMEVEDEETTWVLTYEDESFWFCSQECRDEFDRHPEEYANQELVLEAAQEE
jgi:YHS domain-containing protein